jgi:hypothetical protein
MQQTQPFGYRVCDEIVDARRIAPRPGVALDQAEFNRVIADKKYDRNRRGCCLGGDRDRRRPG